MKKQGWEESEKRRRKRSEKRKGLKKEDAGARRGRKVAKQCFFPNSYLGSSGVFITDYLRRDPVQLRRQVPGKVPVQRLGEVLQGSGADIYLGGSGRFRCRW